MSQLRYLEPMDVVRVRDDTGSHIEPPLDDHWSEEDQVRWMAGVTAHDTGHEVRLNVQPSRSLFGPTLYGYNLGPSAGGSYTHREIGVLLTGFGLGIQAAGARADTETA